MPIRAVLLVAVVVELVVLVAVGHAIGVLPTIGLLVAASVLGAWLVKHEGRRTLREFVTATRERRPPHRELADGVVIAAGGVLIAVPGFVSDVAGLLCLLPPTRALLRRRLERAAARRGEAMGTRLGGNAAQAWAARTARGPAGSAGGDGRGDVIDGEVLSVEEDGDGDSGSGRSR